MRHLKLVWRACQTILYCFLFFNLRVFYQRRVQAHVSSVARETATVLDTALLQGLVLTNQLKGALDMLKGMNYCDLKICEEFLKERNHYTVLLELYKCNGMHHEALKLLNELVEETNTEISEKFKPNMIINYLKVSLQSLLFLKLFDISPLICELAN